MLPIAFAVVLASAPDDAVLSLDAVLTRAWEEAPAVSSAKAQANVARARVGVAEAPTLPSLAASVDAGAGLSNENAITRCTGSLCGKGFNASGSVGAGLDARWLLFDFGRTSEGIRAAQLSQNASDADVDATRSAAAVQAGTAFLALSGDLALVDARKKLVDDRQRLLEIAHGRVEAGAASPIEETRAHVAVETARVDVTTAEAAAADDAASLARALGLDPAKPVRITPAEPLHVDDDPVRAADAAEERRAELQSLKLRVDAAEADVLAARAGRLPSLTATANAGTQVLGYAAPAATVGESASVGAVMSIPLIDAGISAQVNVAEADALVVKAAYREQSLAIRGEAAQAAIAVRSFAAALSAAEQLRAQADENYRQASGRYEAGAAGLLELIDAETQQSSALLSVIEAQYRLEGAKLRLMAAMGTLKR